MILALFAAWHGAFEFGGAARIDKESPYIHWISKRPGEQIMSLSLGLEAGYRFFLGQTRWFIDPVFHVSAFFIVPALQGEVRIGRAFNKSMALYGILGIGSLIMPDTRPIHHAIGVGFSWGFAKKWSLTGRLVHKFYHEHYFSNPQTKTLKGRNELFLTAGVEVHQSNFYRD